MSDETAPSSRIKISWLIGILAAFALFALIASYSSRMTNDYTDYDQDRSAARYDTLAKLRDQANKTLTTADWVDQDKGVVRIPIEEAMLKEIDTLRAKPGAMGAEIPGAVPAAPAANAASGSGATNAAPGRPPAAAKGGAPTAAGPPATSTLPPPNQSQ